MNKTALSRLSPRSVRVRLTLWNMGVLALMLVALGAFVRLSVQVGLSTDIDRRLAGEAAGMKRLFAHHPPGDHGFLPFDHGSGTLGFGPGPPDGRPPDDDIPHNDRHPRDFDLQGRSFHPRDKMLDPAGFARARRGEAVYGTVRDGQDNVRVLSIPRRRNGKIVAVTEFANSLAQAHAEVARVTRTLLTLFPFVLLISGIGGAFLTARALRPVRRLAQAASRIEAENLAQRLPISGDDEFGHLAETFNSLLARLQDAFQRQEQAFEQQRRFTADASHELRTPLTIIKANTSLALTAADVSPALRRRFETVDGAADRMTRLIQDLLLLARSDAGQLTYATTPTRLSEVLEASGAAIQGLEPPPVIFDISPPTLEVLGHADALVRLFNNLLENAARHTPSTGRITVSARRTDGGMAVVEVADTGAGIAPEDLLHLTERFYRIDASRARVQGGTGLGLSICRSIVEAHGGQMTFRSRVGAGTTVRVTLPAAPSEAPSLPSDQNAALVGAKA